MARSYTPTAMYRYGAMQPAGGSGGLASDCPDVVAGVQPTTGQAIDALTITVAYTSSAGTDTPSNFIVELDGVPQTPSSVSALGNVLLVVVTGLTGTPSVITITYDGLGDYTSSAAHIGSFCRFLLTNNI